MGDKAEDILQSYGLKKTKGRIEVMKFFMKNQSAFSQPDLEKKIKSVDRTTLYRILSDFVAAGLLHPVVSLKGLVHYSICHDHCKLGNHQDNHVHFECRKCETIFCMEEIKFPKIRLKSRFVPEQYHYKVVGICRQCQENKAKN